MRIFKNNSKLIFELIWLIVILYLIIRSVVWGIKSHLIQNLFIFVFGYGLYLFFIALIVFLAVHLFQIHPGWGIIYFWFIIWVYLIVENFCFCTPLLAPLELIDSKLDFNFGIKW